MRRRSSRGKPGKAKAQRRHARYRGSTRLGLEPREIKEVAQRISRGELQHLGKQSNRVSYWRLAHPDGDAVAVYDNTRKQVVTFLLAGEPKADGLLEMKDDYTKAGK